MARTPTPAQRISRNTHAVATALGGAVAVVVTMARDPHAHRYQRRAVRHTQRALIRARRVGPRRAVDDRRVRANMRIARAFIKASAHPDRHITRNRILVTGLAAAGVTGGVAYGMRGRTASDLPEGGTSE